jgi:hypothetical protein
LRADAAGFSQANPIEGMVGARGEGLGQHRIQVVGDPGLPGFFGILVQGVFAEAVLLPQRAKSGSSLLLVGRRERSRRLPGRIVPHASQSSLSFQEHGVVELPAGLQVPPDALGLARIYLQRQFQQKRRRFTTGLFF